MIEGLTDQDAAHLLQIILEYVIMDSGYARNNTLKSPSLALPCLSSGDLLLISLSSV